MTTKTVTGLYDSYDAAADTVRDLEAANIPDSDISLVAHRSDDHDASLADDGRQADNASRTDDAPSDTSHRAAAGASTGASTGAALGGGVGLLAGLGMLAIPGVGPVVAAGWLVATAAGAVAGAVAGGATGGLIGSLTSAGVTKQHAHFYAESVRRGGSLVIARVDEGLVATTEAIMRRHGRIDPALREKAYRDGGWTEFDEGSAPYTPADVARERTLYSTRPTV
ncbi:MAG TPA: hypothetical protein VL614_10010 [Acetobacteraceae bacterium]|jgi:hypothetical protein|nr:hypothetical protein [Acetobacteraceae bacterium]